MALIPGKMGLKPTIQERKAVGIPPLPSHSRKWIGKDLVH
jgi:hypothetical protein